MVHPVHVTAAIKHMSLDKTDPKGDVPLVCIINRPRLSATRLLRLTDQPIHMRKIFLRKKMNLSKGARNWRSILGPQAFWRALTNHPPLYWYNSPLSHGVIISHRPEWWIGTPP